MTAVADHAGIPVFILAGGAGTRMAEETGVRPKPMVEIGGIPILVHLMRWYYAFGFRDFVICGGYKVYEIKKYFTDYRQHIDDVEFDFTDSENTVVRPVHRDLRTEAWRVTILNTGSDSMTGARVARAFDVIDAQRPIDHFALTYGDGLSSVDLGAVYRQFLAVRRLGIMLGVKNLARFGEIESADDLVTSFLEKPEQTQGYINGGFFFFDRAFRRYLSADPGCVLEKDVLPRLVADQQLVIHRFSGFWFAMDTLRDKAYLQSLWDSGNPPWRRAPEPERSGAAADGQHLPRDPAGVGGGQKADSGGDVGRLSDARERL